MIYLHLVLRLTPLDLRFFLVPPTVTSGNCEDDCICRFKSSYRCKYSSTLSKFLNSTFTSFTIRILS